MKYSVKVRKVIENGKPLKAICSVTMDEQFTVHGVKVIRTEKGRFIAMPSEAYKDNEGNEQSRDVCHPITSEARKAVEEAVLAAYDAKIAEEAAKTTDTNEQA